MMEQQMQPTQGSQVQQPHGQHAGGGGMDMRLSDVETPEQRTAVEAISRAIQVCEWCADQCVQEADPGMIECIRLCEDVSDLGTTTLSLLPRNSQHVQPLLGVFEQAIEACGRECSRHRHNHCQECAQVLGQTAEALQQFTGSFGQQGGQFGQQGGQFTQGAGGQGMGGFQ